MGPIDFKGIFYFGIIVGVAIAVALVAVFKAATWALSHLTWIN